MNKQLEEDLGVVFDTPNETEDLGVVFEPQTPQIDYEQVLKDQDRQKQLQAGIQAFRPIQSLCVNVYLPTHSTP